jgi:hypothetical protein
MVDQNVKPACWPARNSKPGVAKYKPGAPKSKPVTIKSKSGAMKSKCPPFPRTHVYQWLIVDFLGRIGDSARCGQFKRVHSPSRVLSEKLKHGLSRLARKCRFLNVLALGWRSGGRQNARLSTGYARP